MLGSRGPVMHLLPFFDTVTVVRSRVTTKPSSQNCPSDMRDLSCRLGKMWADRLFSVRPGSGGRRAVCVDLMVSPLGSVTEMPADVGVLFVQGDEIHR